MTDYFDTKFISRIQVYLTRTCVCKKQKQWVNDIFWIVFFSNLQKLWLTPS